MQHATSKKNMVTRKNEEQRNEKIYLGMISDISNSYICLLVDADIPNLPLFIFLSYRIEKSIDKNKCFNPFVESS